MAHDCTTNAPLGPASPTASPGGSGLHGGAGAYSYVWKTEKSWAGTCREITFHLNSASGNYHTSAYFQFK